MRHEELTMGTRLDTVVYRIREDTNCFVQWVQLWDPDEYSTYWYCERTQVAQWEEPSHAHGEESGYESGGALTDYSTDNEQVGGYDSDNCANHTEWQEYWDEQAQAKYWYNNTTVSDEG